MVVFSLIYLFKKITLKHLSSDCKKIMYKASPKFHQVIEESIDDPRYHVVTDKTDFEVEETLPVSVGKSKKEETPTVE